MYHYFARLGRKPYSKVIIPFAGLVSSTSYIGYHLIGHNLARNLLGAEIEPGRRAEIPNNLKRLIMSVYDDVQVDFNKPSVTVPFWKEQTATIKWFSSASMEPVTLGMTEANTGVLIGLPNYYNYDKFEDLPRSLLDVRRFSLFKSFKSKKKAQEQEDVQNDPISNSETGGGNEVIRIDPESEHGRAYLESFVLSEKAKRFSIARELFVGDSYKPLLTATLILTTTTISVLVSRLAVSKFGYLKAHLSQRLPFYCVSGSAGLLAFHFLLDSTNKFYTKSADTRALNLGETYKEGAVEYFTNMIQRHKALRAIFENYQAIYDEKGNVIDPLFRSRNIPITERLEIAKNFKIKAAEN